MNSILKKIILSFSIVFMLGLVLAVSYGASIGLSVTYSTVTVGQSTVLTIKGNDAIGMVTVTSSNPNVVSVSKSTLWLEGSDTVTLTTKSVGTSVITVSGKLSNSSGSAENSLSKSITITSKAVYIDTRSKNNRLASLAVTGQTLKQQFNPEEANYSLDVPFDVDSINVEAVPEDNAARVSVTGNTGLKYGDNMITITVTAENGAERQYKLWLSRSKNPDDINVNLKDIKIANASLKDVFSKEKKTYVCEDLSREIDKLDIEAIPEIEGATVEIVGNENLEVGTNKIILKVKSKDESTEGIYEIVAYKSEEMLSLKDIENENSDASIIDKIKENYLFVISCTLCLILVIIVIVLSIKLKTVSGASDIEKVANKGNFENYNLKFEDNETNETNVTPDTNEVRTRGRRNRIDR